MKLNRPPSAAFHVVTHVWGREYLDLFLDVCIPNQLVPGNLPALPAGSRYRILTAATHVAELDAHPRVAALREVIPVDIVVVDVLDEREGRARGHDLMMACHQKAITDILEANTAIIMLSADFVLSDNALAVVARRHREGYRAIVNTGLRLAKESFLREWRGRGTPAVPPRELVRLAMRHLHPHTESMFVDASASSVFPVAAYWRVGDDGLLARCLHLHPLMVDPMAPAPLRGANDGRYVFRVCPDFSRVHVVTDSDELQMFELTTTGRSVVGTRGRGASTWRAAAVACTCDGHQLAYWRACTVRLHAGDFDERWRRAADSSNVFADRVLRLLPYGLVARRWFWMLERVRQRCDRYRRLVRQRMPRLRTKQIFRPVRIVTGRAGKTLRKTSRRVLRHVWVR